MRLKMKKFGSYPLFVPLDQLDEIRLTYVIQVDKREVLRLYFKHIYGFCCFRFFQDNHPNAVKVNKFGSYPIFAPPGSGQSDMFLTYVIKVVKREVLRLYFKHICVLLLFLVFPGKLPLCSKVNKSNFPGKTRKQQKHTNMLKTYRVSHKKRYQ